MLSSIGHFARRWAAAATPWNNVYGFARSLLAAGTAVTLLFNELETLLPVAAGIREPLQCGGMRAIGAFCLAPREHLDLVRVLMAAAMLIVASGWRPRWTALIHWWISFSVQANALLIDGGDQVASVLALLLLPIALTDPRPWHWSKLTEAPDARIYSRVVARMAATLIRIQVAGIYFHAAVGKFGVQEWADGTAVYYWFNHPLFGAPQWLEPILEPLLAHPAVALVTWSVLLLELLLAAALFIDRRHWSKLLVAGLLFHAGIVLVHGLVSFGMAMSAALIMHLRAPQGASLASPDPRLMPTGT